MNLKLIITTALMAMVTTTFAKEVISVNKIDDEKSKLPNDLQQIDELTYSIFKVAIISSKINKAKNTDTISTAQAAPLVTTQLSTQLEDKVKDTSATPITTAIDLTLSSDFKLNDDYEKTYGSGVVAKLGYKINDQVSSSLRLEVEKSLVDDQANEIKDTKVSFSYKAMPVLEELTLSPSTSVVLPTSEKSKRNKEMNFAVELNSALSYQLNSKTSLTYLPRLRFNNYEYTTSRTNKVLDRYKMYQFFVVGYSFTDQLSFSPTLIYVNSWSHSGRRKDPSYLTNLEFAYAFNETYEVAVGTLNGGSIYDRENGPDKEIEFFDAESTEFYTTLGLKF